MTTYPTFPSSLQPDSSEKHIIDGKVIDIPVTCLIFQKWEGESISNTFGNKGLIDYNGVPMFAELVIQRAAVEAGWDARWVETYAMKGKLPYYFTDWEDSSLSLQAQDPIKDLQQIETLAKVAKNNDNSYSGCWDVLIWNGDRTIFVESKRRKKDRFQATQDRWLKAGLKTGLTSDNFLIVQWDFA